MVGVAPMRARAHADDRFWPKADIAEGRSDVCFRGQTGHEAGRLAMSVIDPKRTFLGRQSDVWLGPKADLATCLIYYLVGAGED